MCILYNLLENLVLSFKSDNPDIDKCAETMFNENTVYVNQEIPPTVVVYDLTLFKSSTVYIFLSKHGTKVAPGLSNPLGPPR